MLPSIIILKKSLEAFNMGKRCTILVDEDFMFLSLIYDLATLSYEI